MTFDQVLVVVVIVTMTTLALTVVGMALDKRRVARLRRDVAIANVDVYEVFSRQLRELERQHALLEARVREQELRP